MQFLERLAYFLNSSNLIISISGGVLTYGVVHHFNLEHAAIYALLVAFLIFSVYTLQRIVDEAGFLPSERAVWKHNKPIAFGLAVVLSVFAIVLGIKLFNGNLVLIFPTLFFCFLCFWYTVPFFGKKLREIPGVKIIVTAVTWAYACVFFPLVNEGMPIEQTVILSTLFAAYFVAIILPFDIRDVHIDHFNQSTVPQVIGVPLTKLFGAFLLLVFLIGNYSLGFILLQNCLFGIAVLVQLILLLLTTERRSLLYFGLIDGVITLLGLAYFF